MMNRTLACAGTASALLTPWGHVWGRDGIYLDRLESDGRTWEFAGELNGSLVTGNPDSAEWIPYRLAFTGVESVFSCDQECRPLHFFGYAHEDEQSESGCFLEVRNSPVIDWTPMQASKSAFRHYVLITYDLAFSIVATGFEFKAAAGVKERNHDC
jgi:hypothetical protein